MKPSCHSPSTNLISNQFSWYLIFVPDHFRYNRHNVSIAIIMNSVIFLCIYFVFFYWGIIPRIRNRSLSVDTFDSCYQIKSSMEFGLVILLIELIRFDLMVSIILFSYNPVFYHKRRAKIRFEMFRINRLIFAIWLSAQCLCHANNSFNSFDFEKIKNQLFSHESLGIVSESKYRSDDQLDGYNETECMQELMAIGQSLVKLDFWAIKRKFNRNFIASFTANSVTNSILCFENSFGFLGKIAVGYFIRKFIWIWCVQSMLSFRTWWTTLLDTILSGKDYIHWNRSVTKGCANKSWFARRKWWCCATCCGRQVNIGLNTLYWHKNVYNVFQLNYFYSHFY